MKNRRGTTAALVAAVIGVLAVATTWAPAAAAPATPVDHPSGSSATVARGPAFDTCTAPSIGQLSAWRASPYRHVNIYFGGNNRGCAQPNLTAAWVREASALGYQLIPTYFGRQPSCMLGNKPHRYTAANAATYGAREARDALAKARSLGLRPGSALYADVEHYDRSNSSCVTAVRRYVSAWTTTLHAGGYLAGVYVHQDSGLRDLSASYDSSTFARPDAVWMARWDGVAALRDWPHVPNARWSYHQRAKQYRGDHDETWGGVTLNIDNDLFNAPVATVSQPYRVTSSTALNARTGPGPGYPVVRSHAPGSTLPVLCQGHGTKVGTTAVWDRLSNGTWVSDFHLATPSNTTFSASLPRCTYPGQVTSTSPVKIRSGPGASYAERGVLRPGALAYVICQKTGSRVGTSRVWNRIGSGEWVSDYYVANRSNTSWSAPVPRCP